MISLPQVCSSWEDIVWAVSENIKRHKSGLLDKLTSAVMADKEFPAIKN